MKLVKYISNNGEHSRREVKKMISEGLITVNNNTELDPSRKISEKEIIKSNSKKILENKKIELFVFNKPAGVLVSKTDPQGRNTIFDGMPKELINFKPIGRLDFQTEGVLLLTNNGDFARFMELPSSNIERVYHVKTFGKIYDFKLKALERDKGSVIIDGVKYKKVKIKLIKSGKNNNWLEVKISEGKNQEVRKILGKYFGLKIKRLIRVKYGAFGIKNIPKRAACKAEMKYLNPYIKSMKEAMLSGC